MERKLAFEQSPPLSVPLPFFVAAPAFALLAALLLLWHGPAALVSRWSPPTLALTHLLTLGFLASVMIGALLQILPVVTRVRLAGQASTARVLQLLLVVGTLALASAFLRMQPLLFQLAILCLGLCFGWLLLLCAHGLWHTGGSRRNTTLTAIRLALFALAITVGLGLALASAFAWPLDWPLPQLTTLHVSWGLPGWIGLLLSGVAFQVVPMFQVTPIYPDRITRWLPAALFAALLLWSLAFMLGRLAPPGMPGAADLGIVICSLGGMLFGITTLWLLHQRKRPQPDATTWFWRLSMASLILCSALWLAQTAGFTIAPLVFGLLFLVGVAGSAVNGMLYKIVPFLIWFHLQEKIDRSGPKLPNVHNIIAPPQAMRQFMLHAVALLLLLAACRWPLWLARPAALAFGGSAAWLGWNLLQALRLYRRFDRSAASPLVVS